MNKFLKYSLFGIGSLIVLLLVAVAVIALTFNPNDYKPLIVKMVQEKKQRTLNFEGDIRLAFWPKLGADLGKISLSERNGSKEFASVQSAKVFVAILPLLHKQMVVDTVRVDGVHANIVRFKDGTTNFDDLLSKEESEIKFDIDGVLVTNAAISLTDEIGNRHFTLSGMELKTGHIAKNQPIDLQTSFAVQGDNPKLEAKMQFKGVLLADAEHRHYSARGLDAALQGDVMTAKNLDLKLAADLDARPDTMEFLLDGLKLSAKANLSGRDLSLELDAPKLEAKKDEVSGKEALLSLTQSKGDETLTAKLAIANLKGSPKAFQSSGISGEISGKQGARAIAGKFSSPFSGNLESMVFDLPKLTGDVDMKDPALPNGAMKSSFSVNALVDIKQEQANATLDASVDGSKIKGSVATAGFSKPKLKFDLSADRLDLNKILGKSDQTKQEHIKQQAAAKPADFSALKNLQAEGKLNVGAISYDKYRIANLAVTVKADGQALTLSPFSAKVDDSQIKGTIGVSHFDKPLYTFDLDIDQIDADRYLPASSNKPADTAPAKPLDLSALKAVNAAGSLRIGSLKYGKIQSSNIRINLKGDGEKLRLDPLSAKVDNSQVRGNVSVSQFESPAFGFDLDIDRLDASHYLAQGGSQAGAEKKPLDFAPLKNLKATGNLHIGELKYDRYQIANLRVGLSADGQKLALSPFAAKVDDSSINATLGVSRFENPIFAFNMDIDRLDADRYVTKSQPAAKAAGDTPIDLSALKTLNASGNAKLGWLKLANVKTSNVKLTLKAEAGQVALAPFSADLYQGSMAGSLNVDARSTPAIVFKQEMKGIAAGPLLVDAINNDMLEGKGTVNVDVKTQGATVNALKKALSGNAALALADGAVKGIDIAGTIRDIKNKFNFKSSALGADQKKRTDFSEMTASFKIVGGVAHNDDLSMKSPLLRVTGSGDIDIGNEKLNYIAKPTVVASLKGQGGADIGTLNGLTFPVKVTGTFSDPKYGLDFAAIGAAIAQKNLLGNIGGSKGEALQKLIGGDKNKPAVQPDQSAPVATPAPSPAPATPADTTQQQLAPAQPAPQEQPQPTPEQKVKKKLNKLLGL